MSHALLKSFKWIFILSALVTVGTYFYKDKLPGPDYYAGTTIKAPVQLKTHRKPFSVQVNDQTYDILPRYSYELEGIVVSLHDADSAWDMYHHDMWKDFLNLRDLCVIWGSNVSSGVYKNMDFKNNTWTCWAYWYDNETQDKFRMNQLSNNHVLSHKEYVSKALMEAEPGDHIRLKGVLAEYVNEAANFRRGTSISRDDQGNGACETIYIDDFQIVKKANADIRKIHFVAKSTAILSLIGFIIFFFIAPVRQ